MKGRRQLVYRCCQGLLWLLSFSGQLALAEPASDIHLQAHRGASAAKMENTIPAILEAIRLGANSIEIDVLVTRDQKLVVFHNFKIEPETVKHPDGVVTASPIYEHTLAELQVLEVTLPERLKQKDTLRSYEKRMPALREIFEAIRQSDLPGAKTVWLDIEVKSDPENSAYGPEPEKFAELLLNEIYDYGWQKQVAVRSFDHRVLREVKKRNPAIPIVALTELGYLGFTGDYESLFLELGPQAVAPNIGDLNADAVKTLHRLKLPILPWSHHSQDKPEFWRSALNFGVRGITGDDIPRLQQFLVKEGLEQSTQNSPFGPCPSNLSRLAN